MELHTDPRVGGASSGWRTAFLRNSNRDFTLSPREYYGEGTAAQDDGLVAVLIREIAGSATVEASPITRRRNEAS